MSIDKNFNPETILPFGSSTNSKSPVFLPEEPLAIARGKGCRVWDIEGREFIDFRNGLGPVTLGYAVDEVNEAVISQINKGIVYGQPHELEYEVAKELVDTLKWPEMVRFLKTGGEAIAAVMRLARAYTGKSHIIQIGYNGWLNSLSAGGAVLPGQSAGGKPPKGVPQEIADLHHTATYGNVKSVSDIISALDNNVSAVIVAADYASFENGKDFYPALRKVCDETGTVLIYDEIVTGFRVALGGVSEYFGVAPDLAVYSKGMANGFPISAYVGKADIMKLCGRGGGVTISSTFAGDAVSLAACKATLNIYKRENVIKHLHQTGKTLWTAVNKLFADNGFAVSLKGPFVCPAFTGDRAVINKFMRAAYKNGVSLYNVSYVNFSHKEADIKEVLVKLEKAIISIKE